MSGRLGAIAAAALLIGGVLAISAPAAAADSAKRGKIRACVDKNGADKGTMRFVRSGKCKKGERKLSWSKRGKRGKQGETGAQGAQGQPGTGATDLLALIEQQTLTIETLQSQLAALTGQIAVVCEQLTTVTTQANDLLDVLDGIGLGGTVPPLLDLVKPALPPPLNAFACP